MTAPRVGKKELLRPTPTTARPSTTFVLARALASPFGILIVLPAIVLAVGLFLTLQGQSTLRASNVSLGQKRLSDQAQVVASHLRAALGQADAMLDRLFDFALTHAPDKPIEPAAAVLYDLMRGRAGVAYASISFADGTFQGAYVDGDGAVRFQDSRVGRAETHVRRYDYRGHDELTLVRDDPSRYDPRQREFFRDAVAKGTRIWTKPYVFYGSHYTGITRAAPVYRQVAGRAQLHAVLTVDFDVNELSRLLSAGELRDMRTLLFTSNGTLLAYPQGAKRIAASPLQDRVLSYRELDDPTLNAFFAELGSSRGSSAGAAAELLRFEAGGTQYLATRARVENEASLDWSVAYLVPEQVFFESLHAYGRRSFAVAAGAVLLALGVSVAFARLIGRVRREAAEARAEAKRATLEARELGSYRLVECLGKGGMGEVWRAEHRLLAREAAIKLIRHDSGAPSTVEQQERFRREAQTLAALRSRNTIELFDYGVAADGTLFYVMELLDGLDLESLIIKHGPQPSGRVLRLLMQACRSLAEAHDAGLVHRDIKPANLFVCRAADEVDVVKVLDFGLVRALAGENADAPPLSTQAVAETSAVLSAEPSEVKLTRAGTVMGTPEFMAPEQALGQTLDGRTDLYALGCVGFWLLTGRVVFRKDLAMQLLLAHIQEPPPPIESYAPGVARGLKLALSACLAKSPEHRPQTARDLRTMLAEAERELAPDARWTEQHAHAWWREHQPRSRASPAASGAPAAPLRIADTPERA
jgi:serine/threonine protein kinase